MLLLRLQVLKSLCMPAFHLLHAGLEICLSHPDKRFPGAQFVLPGAVKGLELVVTFIHRLEELRFLRFMAAGAWFINNLKPSSGKSVFVKDFSFGWCPGACRPR